MKTNKQTKLKNLHEFPILYNYFCTFSDCVIIPKNEMNDEIKNEIFKYMSIYNNVVFLSYTDKNDMDESHYSLIDYDTFKSHNG